MFLHQRDTFWETTTQSPGKVIIEKSRGGRFFMEQELKFLGWIWAGLATFEASFSMFSWAKKKFLKALETVKTFLA